ncbi:hypothetical protein [Archangium lansingense]|uniref:Uncharacterized protein n=1 Tax=Archangium lansingense TaxID=2995310 RepID=A0ABT4A911_9BACT|nr:hypothetical protein [Archangium lansinium]MCY1078151.1 hypothetical protein [Archangium lansinium]
MRSLRSLGNSYWVALVALVLPVAQSHAQQCVKSEGLSICAIGKAQVRQADETSVLLTNLGAAGTDGASVSLGQATDWTAAYETSSKDPEQKTTFTAVSDGAAISSTTSVKKGDTREISATFSGSGADSTYMVQAYRQGELVAQVSRIPNGVVAARALPIGGGTGPSCRPYYQTVPDCLANCNVMHYGSCAYCDVRCARPIGFHNVRDQALLGACRWIIRDAVTPVVLADGTTVEADELVLTEEVRASGSYPYLSFERILFQTSGGSARLGDQTVGISK